MFSRPSALLLGCAALLSLACGGGAAGSSGGGSAGDTAATIDPGSAQDVRGIYAVSWSDQVTVTLDLGGVVQTAPADPAGVVTFTGPDGTPLELDLAAWCADPAVNCPREAWPALVAIDQDEPKREIQYHTIHVSDAEAGGERRSGLVDHQTDSFLIGLDGGSGGSGNCGAVAVSLAGGTFVYPTPADTAVDSAPIPDTALPADPFAAGVAAPGGPNGIADGKVALGWLGVCAWPGLAVAATLSIDTAFEAVRVGDR